MLTQLEAHVQAGGKTQLPDEVMQLAKSLANVRKGEGSPIQRYGSIWQDVSGAAIRELVKGLGPLGRLVHAVLGARAKGKRLERELTTAKRLLEAFGYDVSARDVRRKRRRGRPIPSFEDRPLGGVQITYEPEDEPDEPAPIEPHARAPKVTFAYTPASSNVFAYGYDHMTGELYVQFKAANIKGRNIRVDKSSGYGVARGVKDKSVHGKGRSNRPGPVYVYERVTIQKFRRFQKDIQASGKGAGVAVWDYLRVRGSRWGHQHLYRLSRLGIPTASGYDYVPRRATRTGFVSRSFFTPTGRTLRSTLRGSRQNMGATPAGAGRRRSFGRT